MNKRIKVFLSIITLSLCCSCVMILTVASGSATSLLTHWTINRHADARRADEMAQLEHELEMQREQELAEAKTTRAKSFLTVQVVMMGLGVVAVGIGIVGFGRLMLGRTRSMREGAVIGYAWASKQPVPQSLTYSPNHRHSIKDVSTGQLGELPAQLPAPTNGDLAGQITATLAALGLSATAKEIAVGPQVVTFGITPKPNEKGKLTTVSQISNRADDLAVALSVTNIRIKPAPGYIAVEVPRQDRELVPLADLLASRVWANAKAHLPLALGKDTQGQWVIADLAKLPHLLVGGATNGGKSVALNSMLVGLMNRYTPNELNLLLIDPKRVELMPYNDSPYLLKPVVTDATQALPALEYAVVEMERRYTLMEKAGKKNLVSYNKVAEIKLPWLVIVIDEFADLIMVAEEVDDVIARLAQKARATGMHIILATQRPSKEVVTGLIKANLPGRMSLAVPDGVNSKIILDEMGAEQLLGMGDGLFKSQSISTVRVQAPYISDDDLAEFLARLAAPNKPADRALMTLTPSSAKTAQNRLPEPSEAYLGPMTGGNGTPMTVQSPRHASVATNDAKMTPQSSDDGPQTRQNDDDEQNRVTVMAKDGTLKTVKDKVFGLLCLNPQADYQLIADLVGSNRDTVRKYAHEWRKQHENQ